MNEHSDARRNSVVDETALVRTKVPHLMYLYSNNEL